MSSDNISIKISVEDHYSKGFEEAQKKAKETDKAMSDIGKGAAKIADPLAKAGNSIPIKKTYEWNKALFLVKDAAESIIPVYRLLSSASDAINFETSLADIGKVADFADAKALEDFGTQLQMLSREIPLTVTELAAMAEAGGQMGIAKDQLTGFVEVAAKMATAFKMSGDESGQAIGTLMSVFSLSVPQVEKLGDAINVLGDTTNTNELGSIGS